MELQVLQRLQPSGHAGVADLVPMAPRPYARHAHCKHTADALQKHCTCNMHCICTAYTGVANMIVMADTRGTTYALLEYCSGGSLRRQPHPPPPPHPNPNPNPSPNPTPNPTPQPQPPRRLIGGLQRRGRGVGMTEVSRAIVSRGVGMTEAEAIP